MAAGPSDVRQRDLREKIANGELLPGEQVPSLDALAETYHVSRTTAHRAVQVLVDEGLLDISDRVPRAGSAG
jgi:GntR family transcriptional regulator